MTTVWRKATGLSTKDYRSTESVNENILLRIILSCQIFNCLVTVRHTILLSVFCQQLQFFRTQANRHSSISVRLMIKMTHMLVSELCKIIFISFLHYEQAPNRSGVPCPFIWPVVQDVKKLKLVVALKIFHKDRRSSKWYSKLCPRTVEKKRVYPAAGGRGIREYSMILV